MSVSAANRKKLEDILGKVDLCGNEEDLKTFLLDSFFTKNLNNIESKKNVLRKPARQSYNEDAEILTDYDVSYKYYTLVVCYLNKTGDYVRMKNVILIYLTNDVSIKIKWLGLKLLQKYLLEAESAVIKHNELCSVFIPMIMQYFHFMPPHFKANDCYELINQLFQVFGVIFAKRLNTEENFHKKHQLILEIYSENVISLIIPKLLLSKHEDSPLLVLVLKHLLEDYILNGKMYFVNLKRVLNIFKPILDFPDYLKVIDPEVLLLIIKILEQLPSLDSTDDDFYKYNILTYYILFLKFSDDDNITESLPLLHSNLQARYEGIESDISNIISSI